MVTFFVSPTARVKLSGIGNMAKPGLEPPGPGRVGFSGGFGGWAGPGPAFAGGVGFWLPGRPGMFGFGWLPPGLR